MSQPTKNAQANELRAQARALAAEIGDPSKEMSVEEFETKSKAVAALSTRADFIAGFTPDAEIERQGGESALADRMGVEGLTRVASPESAEPVEPSDNLLSQIATLNKDIKRVFGGMAGYCRAMSRPHMMTGARKELLSRGAAIARVIGADDVGSTVRTIVGTANDASGGEFVLPLQQENSIFRMDNAQQGLLQRARLYNMRGRTLRIPALTQTDNTITRPLSSISAVSIVGEGSAKGVREPVWRQVTLTAFKYAAISKIADELLDDDFTGDLAPSMIQSVGGEIMNQINFDITISGGGTTAPLAALHTSANPALLKVTRTTQNRIKFADAVNMYVKHTHGPNSFWLIGRRAAAELYQFELSAGSPLTWLNTMAANPNGAQLLGYPIVVCDFMNALGSEGDFGLVNPDHYAAALRRQLTVESSIHVEFVNDITTWRYFARGGGVPIPAKPYAYRSVTSTNVDEHSPFVVLDDVYV